MINQVFIQVLGYIFTFVALPALAIIGIAYHRKYKSRGGFLFAIGSIAFAIGSIFNKAIVLNFFLDQTHGLTRLGSSLASSALVVHIAGFLILVLGLGIVTFQKRQ